MLFAYLDESGLNPTAKSTVVGGLIGHVNDWVRFEGEWRSGLPKEIPVFHTRECQRPFKEPWKSITEIDRMALYERMAMIVSSYDFAVVSGSVLHPDWDDARKDNTFNERYPTAYGFCFELCLLDIHRIAEAQRQPVRVVYAISDAYEDRAALVGQAYAASRRFTKWIVSCQPNRPETVTALQAADMACYEIYHQRQSLGEQGHPLPRLLRRMPEVYIGYYQNKAAIEEAVAPGPLGIID